ncbi:MAG: DUF2769 domain-containing protein [Elusimicrobiota bacterium]
MARVEDTKENEAICAQYCGTCPTYQQLNGGMLFCARGKADSEAEQKGCNCPACEVQKNYGCTGSYYCLKGPCE